MPARPGLSKAEMEVARILWNRGAATVREVLESLPPTRKLDYKTVQTYLRRLEAKGYLFAQLEGKSIRYRPRIQPAQVLRTTIDDFVTRLFDGEPLPLVEHLLQHRGLTPADVEKLRTLLDELEKSAKPKSSNKGQGK